MYKIETTAQCCYCDEADTHIESVHKFVVFSGRPKSIIRVVKERSQALTSRHRSMGTVSVRMQQQASCSLDALVQMMSCTAVLRLENFATCNPS